MYGFLFFHCNLAYSSIEEAQRPAVIDRCYTPILNLAEKHSVPVGIEATGWTLEQIALLRPEWLDRLKAACTVGQVEFIGSGYSQIIGPLVPACVNAANQRLGQQTYYRLLGFCPETALINEQAYSGGILEHYIDAGYTTIIMEWDNCSLAHPEWPASYRYAPQIVKDAAGRPLHLLWNQSVIFQQMQRVVHGDTELPLYLDYMRRIECNDGVLCMYGNDAEIFDYRPGRFATEAPLGSGEWELFAQALNAMRTACAWGLLLPKNVVQRIWAEGNHILRLETAAQPVPVKKQPKYNLLRWAVSGRDDMHINSRCFALAQKLLAARAEDRDWKQLCMLWSSDFRTHITEKRWAQYLQTLKNAECRWQADKDSSSRKGPHVPDAKPCLQKGRFLTVSTPVCTAILNMRRGMAFDTVSFPHIASMPLLGTLPHGFFEQISFAADFYSGNVVMEQPDSRKRTDLSPVQAVIGEDAAWKYVAADIQDFFCPLRKTVRVGKQSDSIELTYEFQWHDVPPSSLRLLHLTLIPNAFDADSLFYATHNGGNKWEYFTLLEDVNHGKPVSAFVSATDALGMTEGKLRIGDREKYIEIINDMSKIAPVAMILYNKIGSQKFVRLILSTREIDDTIRLTHSTYDVMTISITAYKSENIFEKMRQ